MKLSIKFECIVPSDLFLNLAHCILIFVWYLSRPCNRFHVTAR